MKTALSRSVISIVLIVLTIPTSDATGATAERQEVAEPSPTAQAQTLMLEHRYDDARALLEQLVTGMPPDWTPVTETSESVTGAYWELAEFVCAVALAKREKDERGIVWMKPSYSRAHYLLAYIALESSDVETASQHIDEGLRLEPGHPTLLAEKALILLNRQRPAAALAFYQQAATSHPCVLNNQKALALRGQGVSLVQLGRFEEAEKPLIKSLEIEPDNAVAQRELAYIDAIRQGKITLDPQLDLYESQ